MTVEHPIWEMKKRIDALTIERDELLASVKLLEYRVDVAYEQRDGALKMDERITAFDRLNLRESLLKEHGEFEKLFIEPPSIAIGSRRIELRPLKKAWRKTDAIIQLMESQ